MTEISNSHKARTAIRKFKTLVDAVMLRGFYRPFGRTGKTLIEVLRQLSPEIYGTMGDPRIVELQGLEYVIDRMPRGIEKCKKIILTAQEDFHETAFEEIIPLKRRRISYSMSDDEICFVITRGASEIYDIITHITFMMVESQKIYEQICSEDSGICEEWTALENNVKNFEELDDKGLDKAIWNLSIILGRTYKETRETFQYLQKNCNEHNSNNGLFNIIFGLGRRMLDTHAKTEDFLSIHFTPSLQERIGHHRYASLWAESIKEAIVDKGLVERPLHIISANMHSVKNVLYGAAALDQSGETVAGSMFDMVVDNRDKEDEINAYANEHGYFFIEDQSGSNINAQLIDTDMLKPGSFHTECLFNESNIHVEKPVILVMDYAFGAQAFELMDELLCPCRINETLVSLNIQSISIMGKAGILPGNKGDIMLANAHVMEGTANNYRVNNDLREDDFTDTIDCYTGPMVTVLGTSLQNRAVLERFHQSSWKAVGLEMEGGHYQRAINAAIIQDHISAEVKIRYAYYASDNPLKSGETLASGPMGTDGIVPTYTITKVILQKILG